jgi:Domain of unknown function (DUF4287)
MSLHHSAETHQSLIDRMPKVTGYELDHWLGCLDVGPGLLRPEERANWLRDAHALPHSYAVAIVHESDLRRRGIRTVPRPLYAG